MLTLNTEKGDRWLLDAYGHSTLQPRGKKENYFDVGVEVFLWQTLKLNITKSLELSYCLYLDFTPLYRGIKTLESLVTECSLNSTVAAEYSWVSNLIQQYLVLACNHGADAAQQAVGPILTFLKWLVYVQKVI